MHTLLRHLVFLLLMTVWCPLAYAQWHVRVEVGADRFWGGSVETGSENRSFRPYRPTTFQAGLDRWGEKLGYGVQLQYSDAAMALEGGEAVVSINGVFGIYGLAPELTYRLATVGAANQLRVHAGPLFELWTVNGGDSRARIGGQCAVSLAIPLGGRFVGSIQAGAALIGSPFKEGELGAEYELQALWRRRFGIGLEYRL